MDSDPTKADLKERIETLESDKRELEAENQRLRQSTTRRAIIGGAGAGVGLLSVPLLFGSATAQSTSGTLPAPSDPPLTKLRADRVVLNPRSSALSSPTDVTITWRSDL